MEEIINMKNIEPKVKFKIKDSVFTNLFKNKKYTLQLFKALFPEYDETVTEEDIEILTIQNVIVDSLYNDLGFRVKNKIIVLAEAQSTWTKNILVRVFLYYAETIIKTMTEEDRVKLYGTKSIDMPKPEFYVIYTGNKKNIPDRISLSEEFFDGSDVMDVKIRVISDRNNGDIIAQYIRFSKVTNMVIKEYGYTLKSAKEIIRICRDEGVLNEYLEEREREVETMLYDMFDSEKMIEAYRKVSTEEAREKAREEGERIGREAGEKIGREAGEKIGREAGIDTMLSALRSAGLSESVIQAAAAEARQKFAGGAV